MSAGSGAARRRVVVVGDVMLDRDVVGTTTRLSPDAPVPVVDVDFRRNLRAVWPGPRRMTNSAAEALLVVATQADAGAWAPSRG